MSKFYAIHAIPGGAEDWELIGVLTNEFDALSFVDEHKGSDYFLAVARPQYVEMDVILDSLVQARLRELAEPIARLAATVAPNVVGMGYEAWRISYQSSEQAARSAYAECQRIDAERDKAKAESDNLRKILNELLEQIGDSDRGDGNAPGHCHEIPGVWDRDNGNKAGKQCAWCALWAETKRMDLRPNQVTE